jgi:hypothetical protein
MLLYALDKVVEHPETVPSTSAGQGSNMQCSISQGDLDSRQASERSLVLYYMYTTVISSELLSPRESESGLVSEYA